MATVRDILMIKGSQVLSIGPEATVLDTAVRMNEHKVGSLVVMSDNQFIGIVSERDILTRVVVPRLDPGKALVGTIKVAGLQPGHAIGLFAGSNTSTPALQAAITTMGNDDPAIGYSVAYPFGVAGPILLLYATFLFLKPKFAVPAGAGMELLEIALQRAEYFGKRVSELIAALPADVQIVAIRRDQRNQPASPDSVLAENDVLLVIAPSKTVLEETRERLGETASGYVTHDRRDLDYLRVFASQPAVVGRALCDLVLPGNKAAAVVQVRRGDADMLARPDLMLEFGDCVGLLASRDDFPALRHFFGDSIKGTAEFSYISIGVGMALGFLVGVISIPIPGAGKISLGLSVC